MHRGYAAVLAAAAVLLAVAHLPATVDAKDNVTFVGAPAVSGDLVFLGNNNTLLVRMSCVLKTRCCTLLTKLRGIQIAFASCHANQ